MPRSPLALAALALSVLLPQSHAADDAALRAAAADLQRGDLTGAEQILRAEMKTHPADADVLSLLGMVLDARRQFTQADPLYRQAIAAAPRSAPVLGRYANHLLAAGDDQAAHAAFLRVVAVDPADPYANLQLARLELKTDDAAHAQQALLYLDRLPAAVRDALEAAVPRLIALDRTAATQAAGALFTQLSNATANDAKLSSSIGLTLARAQQNAQAETFLTHALAANPADVPLLYELGVVALYAHHYDRAREVLEKAVREQPANADALYSLAFVYSSLHQPEAALRQLAEAAKIAPQRADVQRLIAVTTGELQANEDSAAAWDRYATLAPHDDTARRERGFARTHMRQFDTGMADLQWYISRHPDDPVGYYELGLAQSMNDPTKGLSSLDKALQLKPDFVEARAARGALYYIQGKPETAVPDLEAAAAGQPDSGLILDRLGQAYRALDRLDDSIRTLRKAAALAPNEPTIVLHLANALAEAGKDAESETLMGRYRQLRPTQGPRDLMRYLSLTPEQQRADYRARVEKAVHDNPTDPNAQLQLLNLSLEDRQTEQALAAANSLRAIKLTPALLAATGKALLAAGKYAEAREFLEKAGPGVELPLAIATFQSTGPSDGLQQMDRVPDSARNADYYFALAQMRDAAGQAADALAAIDRALASQPSRIELYWLKTALLKKAGHPEEALALLDHAPPDPAIPVLQAALLLATGHAEAAQQRLDEARRRWPESPAVWLGQGILLNNPKALDTAISLGAHTTDKAAQSPDLFFTRPPQDW